MKCYLVFAMLITGAMAETSFGRGFGGWHGIYPGGDGIEGSGELWANGIMGSGGMWGDGAYGAGLPWYGGVPGGNAAYGGFFSGPPQLRMKDAGETYHPLAGEQALFNPQVNTGAQQRQAFASSLSRMGIRMGGFSPGELGPPREAGGLPSDLGMHQVGSTAAYGDARLSGGSSAIVADGASGEGVRNWSAADLRVLGNFVRSNFRENELFSRKWFAQHRRAWYTRGYVRNVWAGCDWADVTDWFGGDWPNYNYEYGNELVYVGNMVYLYGRPFADANKYYDSAASIARTGEQARISSQGPASNWLPLGVFEAIPSGKKSSTMLLQLAVNKAGIIRGNYFDTADRNVQLIEGSVDKDTERAVWVVSDRKNIIFDCVLYNLTQPETPMLVHVGKDKNEQWTFVRLKRERGGDTNQ